MAKVNKKFKGFIMPPAKKPIKKVTKTTIGKGFKDNIGRLAKTISKGKRNEDETRRWIIDVLKEGLGYTEDDIETECPILGKRADIVLMDGKDVLAVIECKSANVQITQAAVNQAANYALALGAEWAITSNGQAWGLYHVEQTPKGPEIILIFNIELLDEDGISKDDIAMLSLITKQSFLSGATEDNFHYSRITEPDKIYNAIMSDTVINNIVKELAKQYKKQYGVAFENLDKYYIKDYLEAYLEELK